jgi:hypothetical protein
MDPRQVNATKIIGFDTLSFLVPEDGSYRQNHHFHRINGRSIILSFDVNIKEPIIPSPYTTKTTLNNLPMQSSFNWTSCNDDCSIQSALSYDDDEDDNESGFVRTSEGRDDDERDTGCVVFRNKPEINNLLLSYSQFRIRRDDIAADENDYNTDLWTLKRAHPISEDDDDDSSCCLFEGETKDRSADCNVDNHLPAAFVVSFDSNGCYFFNPRKKQKCDDATCNEIYSEYE